MFKNKDYQISFSMSIMKFKEKPKKGTFRVGMDTWTQMTLPVAYIPGFIKEGHAFIGGLFIRNKRKDENFIASSMLCIDIDDADVDMAAFTARLPYPPSFSYTTWSNNPKEGIFRFRLVYVLSDVIYDKLDYKALYGKICELNGISTKDNCGSKVSQLMYGNPNADFLIWNVVYSFADFAFVPVLATAPGVMAVNGCKPVTGIFYDTKKPQIKTKQDLFDYLMSDKFDIKAYLEANKPYCSAKEKGKVPYNDLGYGRYPEGYIEVVHRWVFDPDLKMRKKLLRKNGQKRRKHLYLDALKALKICPQLRSYQYNLCYQICFQAYYYSEYDDPKDPITGRDIAGILYNALNTDIEDPRLVPYLISDKVGHYTADKLWCELNGKDHRYYWRTGKKIDSRNWIATWYDPTISPHENLKRQPETGNPYDNGKKVSLRTLKRYCEEKGIPYKRPRKIQFWEIFKPGMKLMEALKYIKEEGLKISRSTVYDYYKTFNINPKTGYEFGKLC